MLHQKRKNVPISNSCNYGFCINTKPWNHIYPFTFMNISILIRYIFLMFEQITHVPTKCTN